MSDKTLWKAWSETTYTARARANTANVAAIRYLKHIGGLPSGSKVYVQNLASYEIFEIVLGKGGKAKLAE